ncbi:MAG: alkaline phosphatase family protein [Chthoniobacterales bacterium]|nr:alkaline phosphatase family protein [Chthoniobacterales bacterium]
MPVRLLFLLLLACTGAAFAAPDHGEAEHVVVVVWDGMRPDFVNDDNTPTLAELARSGVVFKNNHAAYPSSTNVNGAVIATGLEPGRNGIIANLEFRPEIDPQKSFDTADFPALDAADAKLSPNYLSAPTIAELVQRAGYRTAVAGSKPVAQLFDRARERETEAGRKSVVAYRGKVKPPEAEAAIIAAIGAFPIRKDFPNEAEDDWTTRVLTDVLWKDEIPKFSLLWLSEPDLSEHATTVGTPTALAAMKSSDQNLAKVLAALRVKNALTKTDIFVVSDHGFSTVDRSVDVAEQLSAAGFHAVRAFASKPSPGQILVVSLGGSVEFYVVDHDEAVTGRLIDFLQRSDFASVILTRKPHAGTFTFAQNRMDSATAPDVMVACRWNEGANKFGIVGQITSDVGRTLGHGTHSTLSPHDMHNMLIASGPDFRQGWSDETPSGNIDLAPTILWILGISAPRPMDGRVLTEALRGSKSTPEAKPQEVVAQRDLGDSTWRQSLRLTTVGTTTYIIEGCGERITTRP